MRVLTGCSGVGAGFEFASIKLGFELKQLIEIDPYCQSILKLRYPRTPIYDDIKTFRGEPGQYDICCFTPPCQGFSIEGKRRGAADERDCFPSCLRIVNNLQPKFCVFENVVGLLSCPYDRESEKLPHLTQPGSYFRYILQQLSKSGYDAEWLVVSSGAFGAPFLRQRLLLVGIAKSLEPQWERAAPWVEQARVSIARTGAHEKGGVPQSQSARELVFTARGLDRLGGKALSLGVASRNGTIRKRRSALGNSLDPRAAQLALERILYLSSLTKPESN